MLYLGPKSMKDRRSKIDLDEFKKRAPGKCAAVCCSTHDNPWALCDHAGEEGHTTMKGGAHKVTDKAKFKKNVVALCLIGAAATNGVPLTPTFLTHGMPLAPSVLPPRPRVLQTHTALASIEPLPALGPLPAFCSFPAFSMSEPFGSALLNGSKDLESRGRPMLEPLAGTWVAIRLGSPWRGEPPLHSWSSAPRSWLGCVAGLVLLGDTYSKSEYAMRSSPDDVAARVGLAYPSVGMYVTEVWDALWLDAPIKAPGGRDWMGLTTFSVPTSLIPSSMRSFICLDDLSGFEDLDLAPPPVHPADASASSAASSEPSRRPSVASSFGDGCCSESDVADPPLARLPRRVLHVFSGKYKRPGGFADRARLRAVEVDEVDCEDGGWAGNILNDECYERCETGLTSRLYGALVGGPPCNYVTIARIFDTHSGPPVLFTLTHPDGVPGLAAKYKREQRTALKIYTRYGNLVKRARALGIEVITENPIPRHDPHLVGGAAYDKNGRTADHGSYWTTTPGRSLLDEIGLEFVDFAYCALPGIDTALQPRPRGPLQPPEQKYTRVAHSPSLSLGWMSRCLCAHPRGFHRRVGGREPSGSWSMRRLAPWPVALCDAFLDALEPHFAPPRGAVVIPPLRLNVGHWASCGTAAWHAYGVPLLTLDAQRAPAVVHLPLSVADGVPRVALPAGGVGRLFGIERDFITRDSDSSTGQKWADALFAPRLDIYSGWQLTLDRETDLELSVTGGFVSSPPPERLDSLKADTPEEVAARTGPDLVWASLAAIVHPRLYRAVGALIASLHEFTRPAPLPTRVDVTTGAMAAAPVAARGVSIASNCTRLAWPEVVRRCKEGVAGCREALMRAIRDPLTPPDLREQLSLWYDCCKDPDLGDISPALQASCYEADDPRLAHLPFAAFAIPVRSEHMAPLPPPPDQSCVPPWALDWDNAIKPWFYSRAVTSMISVRERLRYAVVHATFVGAPLVKFFAFGVEGLVDWAARLVGRGGKLQRVDGRLRLQNCSHAPATHWRRDALAHALRHSQDFGLCDGVLTHGISYLADLDPIVMISDHLLSLADGIISVHKELARLTDKGWYQMFPAARLDEGKLDLPMLPVRYVPHGSVARKLEPNRFRRVVDNGQPRRRRTLAGTDTAVVSMAAACGWDESKQLRRQARDADGATALGWLRHSPAFRREQMLQSQPADSPAFRMATFGGVSTDPIATSKTPRQVHAMQMAEHGDAARAEAAVAEHALRPRHAAQLVPLFCDLLLDICILGHAAFLLGMPLLGFGDDEADSFHQFMSLLEQVWSCGILMLDPYALAELLSHPERHSAVPGLASFLEGCMSMGTPPSSGYCQRLNTELGTEYEREFHASEAKFITLLCASNARFRSWVDARRQLSARTGRDEVRLLKCLFFADDPVVICAGGPRMHVRGVVFWETFMGPRGINMLMGKPIKREFGVALGWVGGRVLLPGLLGYMSGDKQFRTLLEIDAYLAGTLTCEDYAHLTGLLNHWVCMLAMPYHIMYGVYTVQDRVRELQLAGHDLAPSLEPAVRAMRRWRDTVARRNGTSALAAAFVVRDSHQSLAFWRLFSDASKKGTTMPGICGNLFSKYWVLPLWGSWLELPIVFTEFAGGIINLMVFDPFLGDAPVALIFDALVVPIVVVSKASSKSLMMQFAHQFLLSMPEFARREHSLYAEQTYGPRNVVTDAGSRGRVKELREIMQHMGLRPEEVPLPMERVADFLDRAVAYWRSLTLAEQQLDMGNPGHNLGDGPYSFDSHTSVALTSGDPSASAAVDAAPPSSASAPRTFRFEMTPLGAAPVLATAVVPARSAVVGSSRTLPLLPVSTDASAYSISTENTVLRGLAESVPQYLRMSYAPSTNRIDAGYWRRWEDYCKLYPTPAVRAHIPSHTGVDPVGHRNELMLMAVALLYFMANMLPRSSSDPAADPHSGMQVLKGVRREHEKRGITMAPATLAQRVLTGLLREYVLRHGIRSVARKLPLTNIIIAGMLATPCGVVYHGLVCDWSTYFWVATLAWVSVLAEEGSRKEAIAKESSSTPFERGRLTFASLTWLVDGVKYASLAGLVLIHGRGDGVYLSYGRMKNDPFGVFFSATPSFLPFDAHSLRNACRALAALERAAAVDPARRSETPLFGPSPGQEFTHSQVERAFELMLLFGARLSVEALKDYSIHSFRIFVACALLALHRSRSDIKRALRWRGDASLDIYARLNDSEWACNVFATYTAHVDSTVAARLPRHVGPFDLETMGVLVDAPTAA